MLVALRTAPSHSWANRVERIMSIVNTGLQGIGLMRQKMSDNFEKAVGMYLTDVIYEAVNKEWTFTKIIRFSLTTFIANAKNVKDMREKLVIDSLKNEHSESLAFPIDLIKSVMLRLSLKEKKFQTFSPATEEDLSTLWQNCLEIEKQLQVLNVSFSA